MIELYEKFHTLKQRGIMVEAYTSEFNKLFSQVGFCEMNKQATSRYLAGLN